MMTKEIMKKALTNRFNKISLGNTLKDTYSLVKSDVLNIGNVAKHNKHHTNTY